MTLKSKKTQISTSSRDAASLLNQNENRCHSYETVYGLAGNAYSESIKDFLKKKTFYNPLIVHIKSIADLDKIATDIPEKSKITRDTFWQVL
jgi:L-threonylcarbamoyladenylate synthase